MHADDDDDRMPDRNRFQDDGKSKLVQEAKAMMKDDDEDDKPAVDENAGPKIKMGKIGKKKKKGVRSDAANAGASKAEGGFAKA